ncbi:MAG: sulfatase [Planctomycetales bacterium]|nr:sulfatase [Planctomycetales bacterium]
MSPLRALLCALTLLVALTSAAQGERPNVLFLAVDDLRPQLGCYGEAAIKSPNIDQLAASGVLFERAYCMVPTCGASRAALMTSIRPARQRFINHLTWAEKDAPGITTLNTHFKQQGYTTSSLGKVFHHPTDNAPGWSKPAWRPRNVSTYQLPANQKLHQQRQKESDGNRARGPAWEAADVADNAYADGVIAEQAISELRRLRQQDSPFFLAVGFLKPHLPFVAPQKYWDLYDHDSIRLPETYRVPQNAPTQSIHSSGELRAYAGIPAKGPVSDETARQLIHGYYACVSYTDAQIGKVLAELEQLGLARNTIVVLWGDHGWNLGEHTLWCKHSCYETSMRIPLVIRAPGVQGGQRREQLVESIDLYPTLCELAGLPTPDHVQGASMVAVIRDASAPGKTAAIGRFQNGDTIRTQTHRYTEYSGANGNRQAVMLYDHRNDAAEDNNIAQGNPNAEELAKQLHQGMGRDKDLPRKQPK